jgi:6-phosphofructokinase 1
MTADNKKSKLESFDFNVETLGECNVESPLLGQNRTFVGVDEKITVSNDADEILTLLKDGKGLPVMEAAGPREKLYHPNFMTRAAIVTCGGLCPGLNSVIKGIVETLIQEYSVNEVYGVPYGYEGLVASKGHKPHILDAECVDMIHMDGGSILGSSRGAQDVGEMVQSLVNMRVNLFFAIGGDGTLRGASKIADEIKRRKLAISVVGIPKTIDNDLYFIGNSFGFETAVYQSYPVITAAHMEAKSAYNGLGIVKLMGRDSGFISAYAALANPVVNFCLIPEQDIVLEGENGLLKALERRFRRKQHAVLVIAEGAGQNLFSDLPERKDASGNILKYDIGTYLLERISEYFKEIEVPLTTKYFDPSYSIRSVPASGTDQILCHRLAENAVHAAMAGRTNVVMGYWNRNFVNVPIPAATHERQKIDLEGSLWRSVLATTGQEKYFVGKVGSK